MFRKEEQRLPVVLIDSNSNHWKESHFLCRGPIFGPPFVSCLPRTRLHQIRLFWYQSKEQTEETRFQLSKDVGVGEVTVENQKRYWPLFFRGAKWPKPGRSLARPLSREGGGQIWWLRHRCEGETTLDKPI